MRSDSRGATVGAGSPVLAAAETPPVGTGARDAADDPEIWVDPANPARGVILGTDKQAGLYVYDLEGRELQFLPGGKPNNVDLRPGFAAPGGDRVLAVASDRGRGGVAFYLLDPANLKLEFWGLAPVDLAEPYGLCLGRRGESFLLIVNGTDGQIRQLRVSAGADGKVQAVEERRFAVATQPEGCVVDDARGLLYLGEEGRGIWRFDMTAPAAPGTLIAEAPSSMLTPDVEGLTLLREGQVTWLIASSQGDSSFAVFRVDGSAPEFRGRFSVAASGGIDAVTGTDGVAAAAGPVGRYASGLVVVQDDVDEGPQGARQNFKLVDWAEVKKALGL
ncbi:phytase [Phenylobacterium sp. LjRoot225]|uniref:phytase n=1 Tax=Phenylobacterium sp. LjRoot225 TaxID=3342285 RepID=UPI003ECE7B28